VDTYRDPLISQRSEASHPLHNTMPNGGSRLVITILIIGLAVGFFAWYSIYSDDASPDSPLGYAYALIGTAFLLLAATAFALRRRSHQRRTMGGLRAALGWHMSFALIGLAFLCLHSFGELNPRSGTYALYGLISLVISGLVGRLLDRLMPRLITAEVNRTLNAYGKDWLERTSPHLKAISKNQKPDMRGQLTPDTRPKTSHELSLSQKQVTPYQNETAFAPWDLAYISLESTPQVFSREVDQYGLVPDKTSGLLRLEAPMPRTQKLISEPAVLPHITQREQFYRYITSYWRRLHILLALTTIGLLIWHIVYVLQLMLNY
jgi:hypothetical protein